MNRGGKLRGLVPWLGVLLAAPAVQAATPHVDYMLHCQGCHLADGSGVPGTVPAMKNFVGRFLSVPGGREFLIRVPGSAQSPLDAAALAGVLNWIIRNFDPLEAARGFEPFSPEEVARYRGRPLLDVEPVRKELLEKLRQHELPAD